MDTSYMSVSYIKTLKRNVPKELISPYLKLWISMKYIISFSEGCTGNRTPLRILAIILEFRHYE